MTHVRTHCDIIPQGLSPLKTRGLRLLHIERLVRRRRKLPLHTCSYEYTHVRLALLAGDMDPSARSRLMFLELRCSLLERKREREASILRERCPSWQDTHLFLAQRKHCWRHHAKSAEQAIAGVVSRPHERPVEEGPEDRPMPGAHSHTPAVVDSRRPRPK